MTRAREKARARGQRDYLFRRGATWWIRFQYTVGVRKAAVAGLQIKLPKERAYSLGTTDELEARRKAQDAISEHLDLLAFHQAYSSDTPDGIVEVVYEVEPGVHYAPEGTQIVATESEITTIAPGQKPVTRPNARRINFRFAEPGFKDPYRPGKIAVARPAIVAANTTRKLHTAEQKALAESEDEDFSVLEAYIANRKKKGKLLNDGKGDISRAKRTLREFKNWLNEHANGKPVKRATVDDVENFIQWMLDLRDPPLATGSSVKKCIAYVKAAINLDMVRKKSNSIYKENPFAHAVIPGDDGTEDAKYPSYSDEDMALIRANWSRFNRKQKLLLLWSGSSSVRPGGLASIVEDGWEETLDRGGKLRRTRYVKILRDKGKYGKRWLPIPQVVLDARDDDGRPLLPERIDGPLFAKIASLLQTTNRVLKDIGVNEGGKTFYSVRHRAKDKLNLVPAHLTTEEINRTIMGHARRVDDAHHRYGGMFPTWMLKEVIDHIAC